MSKIELPGFMLADLNVFITSPSTGLIMVVKVSNTQSIDPEYVPDMAAMNADPAMTKMATDWRLMTRDEIKQYLLDNLLNPEDVRVQDESNQEFSPI